MKKLLILLSTITIASSGIAGIVANSLLIQHKNNKLN